MTGQASIMKTQALVTQPSPEMIFLPKILVPMDSAPTLNDEVRDEKTLSAVESTITRLMRHPFLAGMDRRHLLSLSGWAKIAQFNKGQIIFHEGDLADRFYLVETGKVHLESSSGSRDPRTGWSWMFPPHIRTYTTIAIEPVTAIFFYAPALRAYCEEDQSFGYEFLKRLSLVMYRRLLAWNKIPIIARQSGISQAIAA